MNALVEARVRAVAERLAEAGRDRVPGATVRAEGDRVVIEARGLSRRMLVEPALRWPGEWLK